MAENRTVPTSASVDVFFAGVDNNRRKAEELHARPGKHKKSRDCLYIKKLDDVDIDVLREIVKLDFDRTIQTCN